MLVSRVVAHYNKSEWFVIMIPCRVQSVVGLQLYDYVSSDEFIKFGLLILSVLKNSWAKLTRELDINNIFFYN